MKAELHLMTVLPDFGLPMVGGFFPQDYEKTALREMKQSLADFANKNVPDNVAVKAHVAHGTIYEEILQAAESLKVDMIVISAHRPELQDYLLGPNAARVARHAACSVLVVRGEDIFH